MTSGKIPSHFAELLDSLPDVLAWVKDRQGRYLWVNRAFLIQYSLDHPGGKELAAVESIQGKTDYDLSPAFLADQFRHDDEQVLAGHRIVNRLERVGESQGTTVWNITDKIPVIDAKGAIIGTAGITIIAFAEPGQTIHQPFADAAQRWLQETAAKEGFTVDDLRTTDPIDDAYLAAHDLFVQVNYPPYRWTPVAEAAFKKAMEQGTIGWVGFHHASLLDKFDGFEMSPFFHQFIGDIVFKSYIPDSRRGRSASKTQRIRCSRDCRQHSRLRTTSGTPTTDRLGPTYTCSQTLTRTATSRRAP